MRLEIASWKAIEYACKHFHYSKSVPANPFAFSVFNDNDEWCGCVIFGPGANNHIGSPYGLKHGEAIELVRMALNGKQATTSQVLGRSLKVLKKYLPLCKLVVSYADVDQDHTGIIYQATNWIYEGKVNVNTKTGFIINGKKTHNKSIHSKGIKQNLADVRKRLDPNATEFVTKGKHKYLFPLDKGVAKRVKPLSKPYPKKPITVLAQSGSAPEQSGDGVQIDQTVLNTSLS